jgi:hypothetical protein
MPLANCSTNEVFRQAALVNITVPTILGEFSGVYADHIQWHRIQYTCPLWPPVTNVIVVLVRQSRIVANLRGSGYIVSVRLK